MPCIVVFNLNSLESPSGNQWFCCTPLGMEMKAMRSGAPVAVVAALATVETVGCAAKVSKWGSTTAAPNPRKSARRLNEGREFGDWSIAFDESIFTVGDLYRNC